MLHKAGGALLSLISQDLVCGRCRVFSGSVRIDCVAYFRDSVLWAVSGFSPALSTDLTNPFPAANKIWLMYEKPNPASNVLSQSGRG